MFKVIEGAYGWATVPVDERPEPDHAAERAHDRLPYPELLKLLGWNDDDYARAKLVGFPYQDVTLVYSGRPAIQTPVFSRRRVEAWRADMLAMAGTLCAPGDPISRLLAKLPIPKRSNKTRRHFWIRRGRPLRSSGLNAPDRFRAKFHMDTTGERLEDLYLTCVDCGDGFRHDVGEQLKRLRALRKRWRRGPLSNFMAEV